jgi:DNA-binding beta-propeller fold protein YncE
LFNFPDGVAVDHLGNVYVTDTGNNRLQKFTSDGVFLSLWGGYGTGQGQFSTPFHSSVAPNGDVFVSDSDNMRVQRFSPQTPVETVTWGRLRTMFR